MRPDCRHDGGKRYWPRAHRGAKDTAACGAPCPSGPSESAQYTAEIRNRADALFPPPPSYVIVGGPLRRKPVAPAKPRPLTTTSRAGPKSPPALRSRGPRSAHPARQEIGRAHVCTSLTNAHTVCRLILEKKHIHIKP